MLLMKGKKAAFTYVFTFLQATWTCISPCLEDISINFEATFGGVMEGTPCYEIREKMRDSKDESNIYARRALHY